MTVLFLKYVPRKYKLDNDHFSCSGENSTETKDTAQGARKPEPTTYAIFTQSTLSHLTAAVQEASQCDAKTLSIEKLQLGLKTYWC